MTEEQALDALVEAMGNPLDFDYDESEAIKIFEQISKIPGAMELFRAIMGRDMRLYWMSQDDTERAHIKGAHKRIAWMRGIMQNVAKYKELNERKALRHA